MALGKIMSKIGRLLYMDKATASRSRLGYACICVEVQATYELPDSINFSINGVEDITIKLDYAWKLVRCDNCRIFGHTLTHCPKKEVQTETQKWVLNQPSHHVGDDNTKKIDGTFLQEVMMMTLILSLRKHLLPLLGASRCIHRKEQKEEEESFVNCIQIQFQRNSFGIDVRKANLNHPEF
ncbi:hypothetical protein Cni_G16476 [Canna indica]|uniref:DUF4283 domain-containing protein n=1 Tax=Canna indica TaxID=4628 RepID=A0AAQ3KG46_9LILI|nr:hypothetical protein Cni_G16476 [Canna indica]